MKIVKIWATNNVNVQRVSSDLTKEHEYFYLFDLQGKLIGKTRRFIGAVLAKLLDDQPRETLGDTLQRVGLDKVQYIVWKRVHCAAYGGFNLFWWLFGLILREPYFDITVFKMPKEKLVLQGLREDEIRRIQTEVRHEIDQA